MYDILKVDFIAEHRLIVCHPPPIVDECFAVQLLNYLFALEEVARPLNRLLDLTLTTHIPLTSKQIQEYSESRWQATARLAPFRTAVIAPHPEAEAVAHLYATLVKGSKIEVGVFRDAASAARWLNVPKDALRSPAEPESVKSLKTP